MNELPGPSAAQPLRVACHALGCRLNQCDAEAVLDALRDRVPVAVVAWGQAADLYLLASCTVTARAAQECRRLARQVKARRPRARVVVTGCYAQVSPGELAAMPEVDAVLGHGDQTAVDRWLPDVLAGGPRPVLVSALTGRGPLTAPAPAAWRGHSRAFLKVQDGCDRRCAYCQIWQARGPARSLPPAAVRARLAELHDRRGYHEAVLSGVDLGAWGRDLTPPRSLHDLLADLTAALPGLRLRLSSLHPDAVTPDLVDLMARGPAIRPHLHLALQSGSDAVLRRMGRPYRSRHIAEAVALLSRLDPLLGLGADLIAGFPGESPAEFAETEALVARLPLSYLHVFRFSPRPGTAAAAMAPVATQVAVERARSLRALGLAGQRRFEDRLLGTVREAVIERPHPGRRGRRRATLDNHAAVTVASGLPAGSLAMVRTTGLVDGTLHGEVTAVIAEGKA